MRWSRQGPCLLVWTPAKLNLSLKVLGRRQDGYHNLETVMVSVRLYDSLRLMPRETSRIDLRCRRLLRDAAPLPVDDRNLIVRAARLLQSETGCQKGVDITLGKRIPSEAGMGGGSSDAAATLAGLNILWNLGLTAPELHSLAARLGSDVNFFLENTPLAMCTGRGESIEPLPLRRRMDFVVVQPQGGLATRDVFAKWSGVPTSGALSREEICKFCNPQQLDKILKNDLQGPACDLHPGVERVIRELRSLDVSGVLLTGSGSACFAVCRSSRHAACVASRIRNRKFGRVFQVSSGV